MDIYLVAIKAAIEAGKEILKIYNSDDFEIENKIDNSPLTKADKNAHLKIMEYLSEFDIPVLSEEGKEILFNERKAWQKMWIVDPLDGTKEFIKRNGEFTVNIALVENGVPIFGVIYVPVSKELYVGINGLGSYKFKDIIDFEHKYLDLKHLLNQGIKLPIKIERPFTVVASRSHLNDETKLFIDSLKKDNPSLEFISKGSSLKLCAVAEGIADIYPRFAPTMEWDTAAGQAIVESAGGVVQNKKGEHLKYNKENLLNPHFIVKF
ncbi:MAG: 3'(2'),5'-bisphosphate nucleotidase CysQ [Salinivirgaceae bacterium]|nr:3'(2'),5'-bisphosphate nucleotidase CysQ [Salinivirgaceae bacterium]